MIYGLGMLLGRAASLIMLPLYTRMLTPIDYGVLQILDMTNDVVSILVSAGCTAGVMRFFYKADTERERRAVLGSAAALQIGLNLVGSILLVIFAEPIWRHALHGLHSTTLVYLAAANFTLGSLAVVPMILMQLERRAALYSTVSFVRLLLQLSGNVFFLVVMRWGPAGILVSSFIVNVLIGAWTIVWLIRRAGFVISRGALLDLRRFGIPYQVATLGTFIVTFGDRLFLDKYSGLATVGLYSIAYQFGFVLDQVGMAPYMRAWTPRRFESAREPREVRDARNAQGFLQFNLLAFTCAVGIALFVHPVLRILSDREYWPAANIVPIILLAYIVQGWVAVVELGIDVSEKTKYATYSVWLSVVAVLVAYTLLIPRFGGYGAAWATVIAFGVRFIFHWRFSQRLWPIRYGWGASLRVAAYAIAVGAIGLLIRPHGLLLEIGAALVLLGFYSGLVWKTVLREEDRRALLDFVVARTRVIRARFSPA